MTDAEVVAMFERLWAEGMKKPQGANMWGILQAVSKASGRPIGAVRKLMLDSTFCGGAG